MCFIIIPLFSAFSNDFYSRNAKNKQVFVFSVREAAPYPKRRIAESVPCPKRRIAESVPCPKRRPVESAPRGKRAVREVLPCPCPKRRIAESVPCPKRCGKSGALRKARRAGSIALPHKKYPRERFRPRGSVRKIFLPAGFSGFIPNGQADKNRNEKQKLFRSGNSKRIEPDRSGSGISGSRIDPYAHGVSVLFV